MNEDLHNHLNLNLCRLCAQQCQSSSETVHLFKKKALHLNLVEKVHKYLPIKVTPDDESLFCCKRCVFTILEFDKIYLICLNTAVDGYHIEDQDHAEDDDKFHVKLNDLDSKTEKDHKEDFKFFEHPEPYEIADVAHSREQNDALINHFQEESVCEETDEEINSDADSTPDKKRKRKNCTSEKVQGPSPEELDAAKIEVDGKTLYNCKICGKNIIFRVNYKEHLRIHTGERPYICHMCGKRFRRTQGLGLHIRLTHKGEKNYPCEICGRKCQTKQYLVNHRRIHADERSYVCTICGKGFKQKAGLHVHSKFHLDSFPFKCTQCVESFRTKPKLMQHVLKHTGEKPHSCDVCGKSFRLQYALTRHKTVHSDEFPFPCGKCGAQFKQSRYLLNHVRTKHPDDS